MINIIQSKKIANTKAYVCMPRSKVLCSGHTPQILGLTFWIYVLKFNRRKYFVRPAPKLALKLTQKRF